MYDAATMMRRSAKMLPVAGTVATALTLCAALVLSGGCALASVGTSGVFQMHPAHEPRRTLPARFDTGFYSIDDANQMTIVLMQGASEKPERAMTIRLFWRPRPGTTPLRHQASNAMVRYVHFEPASDKLTPSVRVYSGAGFLWPHNSPGRRTLAATLREATLRLIDDTTTASDADEPPEQMALTGAIRVRRDDAATVHAIRQIQVAVSEALAYPRFVHGSAGGEPLARE